MSAVGVDPTPGAGAHVLPEVATDRPVPLHRAVFILEFDVGQGATGVEVLPDGAVLRGTFLSHDVEVPIGSGDGQAHLTGQSGGVRVELPHARRIQRVVVTSSAVSSASLAQLRFFRIDVDQPADTATTRGSIPGSRIVVPADPFIDVRFLVRGYDSGSDDDDDPAALAVGGIESLRIRGYPTGPRLSLADPADLDRPAAFWQAAGEQPAGLEVDVGADLAAALQAHLDARFRDQPPSGTVAVALLVESDAPARFRFDEGPTVSFRVRAGALAGGDDKIVLRFSEALGFRHAFHLDAPGSGTAASAVLTTAPSFRGQVPVDPATPGAPPPGSGPPAPWDQGAFLEPGRWVGQRVALGSSVVAEGLILALLGVRPDTEILVEVRADRDGRPAGSALAAAVVPMTERGRPRWIRARPDGAPRLDPPAAWILATARRGAAVWLAEPTAGEPARLYPSAEPAGPDLGAGSALAGLRCTHRLVPPRQAGATGATGAKAAPEGDAFILEVGGVRVPRVSPPPEGAPALPEGRVLFDLTPALAGALAALPAGPGPRRVEVVASALAPGLLTVYRPDLRMDA